MYNQRNSAGVASWFLIVLVFISILLTIAFAAQNIMLRSKIKGLEEEVTQNTDQSTQLENFRTQVDNLTKENQDLKKSLDSGKADLKSIQDQMDKIKQQSQPTKKPTPKPSVRRRKN